MTNPKLLQRLKRIYWAIWLVGLVTGVFTLAAEAAPEKETLCHFGETKQVPSEAVTAHLAHGDYLGVCVAPTPESTPEPTPTPTPVPAPSPASTPEMPETVIENMWLIVGEYVSIRDGAPHFFYPSYCILISDTHPSIEQQQAKCFPREGWYPQETPCAGPIYANDVWACDDELQERGWSRLSLDKLCQRYPKWCDR